MCLQIIYIYYIRIHRIWHWITDNGWYAIKPNQTYISLEVSIFPGCIHNNKTNRPIFWVDLKVSSLQVYTLSHNSNEAQDKFIVTDSLSIETFRFFFDFFSLYTVHLPVHWTYS